MPPLFSGPFPIFAIADLPATVRFHEACFGFARDYQWPADGDLETVEFVVLLLGEQAVGFGRVAGASPATDHNGVQLCLQVDDIHEAWRWLAEHGATPVEPPTRQPWDEWSAVVADPGGLRIMLYAPHDPASPAALTD